MPELPEVEIVVRQLRPRLEGRLVVATKEHFDGMLVRAEGLEIGACTGQQIESLSRRGKMILIQLGGGLTICVHLGMSGHLSIDGLGSERERHTHVCFELDGQEELRYRDPRRFGRVELVETARLDAHSFLARLGPEPSELSAADLAGRLRGRTASIKAALLDQGLVAGLGNIYVDEILFRSRLHPLLVANRLLVEEVGSLHRAMIDVLGEAVRAGGSTVRDFRGPDGRRGGYQQRHQVFGREGQDCLRCTTPIRKIRVVGRGTHYCPRCQPWRRRRPRPRISTNPDLREGNA